MTSTCALTAISYFLLMSASYHKSRSWLPWNWLNFNNNNSNTTTATTTKLLAVVVGSWCIWCTFLPVSLLWPRQVLDTQKPSEQTNERRPQLQHTHTHETEKKYLKFRCTYIFFSPCLPLIQSIHSVLNSPSILSYFISTRIAAVAAECVDKCSQRSVPHTHKHTLSTCNEIHILRCRPPTPLPLSCS